MKINVKGLSGFSLKTVLGVAVMAGAVCGGAYSIYRNFNADRSMQFLQERGYTDITLKRAVFSTCGNSAATYKYQAINPDGELERSRLCQNVLTVYQAPFM